MSIRLRLALWYGALLSTVLAVTLSLAFLVHLWSHEADVDFALRTAWQHAAAEIAVASRSGNDLGAIALVAPQELAGPGALWVLDPGSNTPVASAGALRDPVLREVASQRLRDGFTSPRVGAGRVRAYAASEGDTRIVVAASLADLDASLARLGLTLLTVGALGIAAAIGGGWIIASSALRPVATMTETARAIALSRGFSRRVAIAEHNDELGELARTFNEMLASLGDAYRRQQRFVGDVSHELRTPLTTIQGNAEILARPRLDEPERAEAAAHVLRESARLARLVDDLLVLARADAGPQPFLGRPVELDELLVEAFTELRQQAGARLRLRALESAVIVGERDRLKQLVLILVDNALRYTPNEGQVSLSLATDASQAVLRVEDAGIGITPQDEAHVFERFYRGEAGRRLDPSGTGLGLAIARWIVERHGGTIALEPRSPRGTIATARVPLANEAVARPAAAPAAAGPSLTSAAAQARAVEILPPSGRATSAR